MKYVHPQLDHAMAHSGPEIQGMRWAMGSTVESLFQWFIR